ncbi:MAG: hypothetical protein IT368_18335 [Candidatus Hydrogenedentes bacterium]|nr:hypothetical protein [Candidatus Hydrogenedentota bacterium]
MTKSHNHSAWIFVFFPAIAMLLGWGLRGYIGGGPFGALIPGCYVALCLCLLLGYSKEAAAMAALFGAVGIGYGGDMTYGQTLGFLSQPGNVWWGLVGCLLKGGVWGLLGGAVLGIGLTRWRFNQRHLVIAFLLSILAFYIGIKLINEPKILYFSDPVNKPRDESWAGLLFAAIAILGYLRLCGEPIAIPLRFAAWGALGGAAGFAGGALWMVVGPGYPAVGKWIGWWKSMEFSFGFLLGAALGWAAWRNRDALQEDAVRKDSPGNAAWPTAAFVLFTIAIFASELLLEFALPEDWMPANFLGVDVLRILFCFIFYGAIAILLGMRSLATAWQIAITLTFLHSVYDYVRDLDDPAHLGVAVPLAIQLILVLIAAVLMGWIVNRTYRGPDPIRRLLLIAIWSCYLIATLRSFLYHDFLFPPEGESLATFILNKHASLLFVHGTFTVSALVTTGVMMGLGAASSLEDLHGSQGST